MPRKYSRQAPSARTRWELVAVVVLSAAACNAETTEVSPWSFRQWPADAGADITDVDRDRPPLDSDGGCSPGATRPTQDRCGYENRGDLWHVCVQGDWQRECRGVWFNNCRELHEARPEQPTGEYELDPGGSGSDTIPSFRTRCDMKTDGGGWTKITPCLAKETLDGELDEVRSASESGFDSDCRPYATTDFGEDSLVYHDTFEIPGGFEEFYLSDYEARARSGDSRSSSELNVVQHDWKYGADYCAGEPPPRRQDNDGDISFGSPSQPGPETSFSRVIDDMPHDAECFRCTVDWPEDGRIFRVDRRSDDFRISWSECGEEAEGWWPWWSGAIWVR